MSYELEGYVKVGQKLRGLKPILQSWVELHNRYLHLHKDDVAYWYNERASVSVLAGAACTLDGWISLEEYVTDKRTIDPESRQKEDKRGRCDFYMTSKHISYACEAKQAWQNVGEKVVDKYSHVKSQMANAWKDIGEIPADEYDLRLGVCFITPRYPKSEGMRNSEELLEWAKGLMKLNHDALGWCFPKGARNLELNGKIYPGTAVIFQWRQRGRAGKS